MNAELAAAMQAAWEAELSVIPVGPNKRPMTKWSPFIDQRCELDQLHAWMAADLSAYGVVCGGPTRLLVLDFEGRFMPLLGELSTRLEAAGMREIFETWISGYAVATPGKGLHVAIHLGDGIEMPGNEKLVMLDGLVAVETRGQGGFVVGPGSNGDTHPSGLRWEPIGGSFESVAWATVEEWLLIRRVLCSFDESAPSAPRPPTPLPAVRREGGWIDAALAAYPPIEQVLPQHGWQRDGSSDEYGERWIRPGKNPREGHSASVRNGRLYNHSANAGLPVGNPTLDAVDVALCYRLSRRPTAEERVAELKKWSPATATAPARTQPTTGEAGSPPTMDPSLVLPSEFWQARPYLAQLATAAWARQTSPDLVWEAFKAMYASTIPWNFRLPDEGTLDYIAVMVGDSGSGKTLAKRAAASLLPPAIFEIEGLNPLLPPPASGEGMAEWYMDRSKNAAPGALANRGGCFYLDEGQAFFDRANRQGNIVIQTMKSGWSGESIGSLAASGDRRRVIQPSAVRVGMLISIQIAAAAQFLAADLTAGGLPQRISWAWAYHPDIPEVPGEWSGQLDVPVYDYHKWGGSGSSTLLHQITVVPEVKAEVAVRRDARRRAPGSDVLDAQADYARLKTAGILALLDDRREIGVEDWKLAGLDWETSAATRGHVQREHTQAASEAATAAGRFQAHREIAAQGVHLEAAIASLCRKVSSSSEPLQLRQVKEHLARYRRQHGLHYREVLDHAVARGKVVIHSDGTVS